MHHTGTRALKRRLRFKIFLLAAGTNIEIIDWMEAY